MCSNEGVLDLNDVFRYVNREKHRKIVRSLRDIEEVNFATQKLKKRSHSFRNNPLVGYMTY